MLLMSTKTIKKTVAEYFKTQPVVKAWLFGSYARGEETPDSDVDIMVVLDSDAHVGLFQLSGMHLDLQDRLQKRVDLVTESGLLPFARESAEHGSDRGYTVQRYKGLGEMSDVQLWDTTMNPARRRLRQITIENAAQAERTFSMLMGDDVPPRRQFIEENAHYANIDA